MNQPQLVIMAAGLGSRYGGLKQIEPIDEQGQNLLLYAVYDAAAAGFTRVVVILKPETQASFHELFGRRIASRVELRYAIQKPDALPAGFAMPDGRVKPWGTGHAVLSAKDQIDAPCAVINADDFYGRSAFSQIYQFLREQHGPNEHAMVGYRVENTLTENGSVARGVCAVENGYLKGIVERTFIVPKPDGAAFSEDGGKTFTFIPKGTRVSMNLWGFQPGILDEFEARFPVFLREQLPANPLKCEYYLPLVPNQLLQERKASFRVLDTHEKWFGVTYHDDMANVKAAVRQLHEAGVYPEKMW